MATNLDTQISYKTLINWHLHWLICGLDNTVLTKVSYASTVEDVARYINIINTTRAKVSRLCWEIVTMDGLDDSEFDIIKSLSDVPRYKILCNKIDEATDILKNVVNNIHNNQAAEMFASLGKDTP